MIYLSKQRIMKYYIPTSSLNLDNILQAECISPSSFYSERETGYKSIEVIKELKGINRIVMFQYPVRFTIDDPNRYNYPLLIEVEDENQLHGDCLRKESNGIYTYSQTLYLTPTNCRLFFFTEDAYSLTTINTRSNKSIKYYEKYLIFPTTAGLTLKEMPIINIEEKGCLADNTEFQNDKKKGLLYAYLLGQRLSLSPELARQNKLTQDIYDIVSGIIANPSMSEMFMTKLNVLVDEYKSVDAIEKENELKFNSYLIKDLGRFKFLSSCLIDLLKKWDVWDYIYRKLSNKWECNTLPLLSELTSRDDYKRFGEIVERHTEQSIVNYRKTVPHPSLTSIHNNNHIYIEGLPILTIAVNYIINNKITTEQLSAHRADHCLGIINEIKTYYINEFGEESWNKNVRTYVNNLYSHIQNIGYPFNIHSIESAELLAIAAFLLRGQNIDNYLTFLKMNEISDYCCPLVLWGASCGYMEMNKDILSDVLSIDNYKDIYRHLFSCDMYETVWEKEVIDILTEQRDSIEPEKIESFITSISKNCEASVKKYEAVYIELFKIYGISDDLLAKIEQNSQIKKGKATVIKNIKKMLVPPKTKRGVKKREKGNSPSLFPEEINSVSSHINGYDEALAYITNNAPEQIRKNLKSNLVYIDKKYTGYGKYANTGDDPIKHFLRLCFSMSNKWNRIEETSENRKYVEQICVILSGNRKDNNRE